LRGRLQAVRVAVNEEFVERSCELRSGDVVALIPPVSGG
jgi:molybdopterin converting factor small subunit